MNIKVKGFTLIEVLVAVLLLSIGLLGLASLQTWGLKLTGNAMYRSQATLFANDMVERIRANAAGTASGAYAAMNGVNCGVQPTTCRNLTACNPLDIARIDFFSVMCGDGPGDGSGIDDTLPAAPGAGLNVQCSGTNLACTVEVSWSEVQDRLVGQQGPQTQSVQVTFFP